MPSPQPPRQQQVQQAHPPQHQQMQQVPAWQPPPPQQAFALGAAPARSPQQQGRGATAEPDAAPGGSGAGPSGGGAAVMETAPASQQLDKHEILERIKPLLKEWLAQGRFAREQYKAVAKAATHHLFGLQREFSDAEARAAVDQAAAGPHQ